LISSHLTPYSARSLAQALPQVVSFVEETRLNKLSDWGGGFWNSILAYHRTGQVCSEWNGAIGATNNPSPRQIGKRGECLKQGTFSSEDSSEE
jgi:hypothetical protein